MVLIISGAVALIALLVAAFVLFQFGWLWIEANSCGADITLYELITMPLRGVNTRKIVTAKIMGRQSGIDVDRKTGMSTQRLESHMLSGGDVIAVVSATIAARCAELPLGFERAMSIDLAGRDIAASVRTTVLPRVIHCPSIEESGKETISGISKDGIELRIRAWITVRTNLDQLIGGAMESTIIARVGQGIVSAIGATDSFRTVLETPSLISKRVLDSGLDANTAFEIVSVDIVNVSVGTNIGAALTLRQAEADMKTSTAQAESRRSMAISREAEAKASIAASQADLVSAEALVPAAIAYAFHEFDLNGNADDVADVYPKLMDSPPLINTPR